MSRDAHIVRSTAETSIDLSVGHDGGADVRIDTGIGFFDHMLQHVARHGGLEFVLHAQGDLHVDEHHLVEDVGIVLGEALKQALGRKEGLARYGWALVPMDESLVMCAVDLGGRPYLAYGLELKTKKIKEFETELVEEFFRALVNSAEMNLHLRQLDGRNTHHLIEASFKSFARALGQAVALTGRAGVPSTKGVL